MIKPLWIERAHRYMMNCHLWWDWDFENWNQEAPAQTIFWYACVGHTRDAEDPGVAGRAGRADVPGQGDVRDHAVDLGLGGRGGACPTAGVASRDRIHASERRCGLMAARTGEPVARGMRERMP